MMTLKRVVCVTLVAAAANLSQDVCGFGVNHRHIQRSAAHSSTTAMQAEPTASEKAAELRKKAEEAKRKAEELRKVAEEKAAKAMMAVKEAQSKSSNNGATATPITARPPTPPPVKRVDTPCRSISIIDRYSCHYDREVVMKPGPLKVSWSDRINFIQSILVSKIKRSIILARWLDKLTIRKQSLE